MQLGGHITSFQEILRISQTEKYFIAGSLELAYFCIFVLLFSLERAIDLRNLKVSGGGACKICGRNISGIKKVPRHQFLLSKNKDFEL